MKLDCGDFSKVVHRIHDTFDELNVSMRDLKQNQQKEKINFIPISLCFTWNRGKNFFM